MGRTLHRVLPIVVIALAMQILAPIAACWSPRPVLRIRCSTLRFVTTPAQAHRATKAVPLHTMAPARSAA